MKLTRLRIVGFKTFVDPVEMVIEPGLSGVVGPNGCGKSNLVEALRWVMGESSHKALRAAEMNDVIFSGSGGRPARSHAEVVLWIDNTSRRAPSPYSELDELEVSRRIQRDKGSTYRINSREVRARDAQLLFADASTGARSPAMVRQGLIGEIVNARPEARRRVLEEAAGIAGLHARRYEAELRLRTTEQNLERVEDISTRLHVQLDGLKRQARQAVRYRQLSADIRRLELTALRRIHAEAAAEVLACERAVAEAEQNVAALTLAQGEAARAEAVAAHALPPLREAAAGAGAARARIGRAIEDLDREERAAAERLAEARRRAGQLEADLARERALAADAAESLARLERESSELAAADAGTAEAEARLASRTRMTASELARAEAALAESAAALAAYGARRDGAMRARAEAAGRLARLSADLERVRTDAAALRGGPDAGLERLRAAAAAAAEASAGAESDAAAAEAAMFAARAAEAAAQKPLATAESDLRRLEVEQRTLANLLKAGSDRRWPALIDSVTVARGYEAALGAALGEDLEAADDVAAPVHWDMPADGAGDPPLPHGATPLADVVTAPPALARRLAQIGIVARGEGAALRARLAPGQRLVSVEGDLWRWDGFTSAADAPSAAARRLAERNRLIAIEGKLADACAAAALCRKVVADAQAVVCTAVDRERQAREQVRTQRAAAEAARGAFDVAEREHERRAAKLAAMAESEARLAADQAEARRGVNAADADLAGLPPAGELEQARDADRSAAEAARLAAADARAAAQAFTREREVRRNRIAALARERASWDARQSGAGDRLAEIEARRTAVAAESAELEAVPDRIAGQRRALLGAVRDADLARAQANDRLAVAERDKARTEQAAREALQAMSGGREGLVREETRLEAARERRREARHRLDEALAGATEEAAATSGEDMPAEAAARELDRLKAERDRLGAVNLRAEAELTEVQSNHDRLMADRDDLLEAIRSLRGAIQSLNREGRERLAAAFARVDGHFRHLFTTLFGGGEARLELIESDDPLAAGLDVVACPPGKRPQTLSLLSGGEQALTALALIFAIFLTNPAPICVLDEVDAPLDDANVERFCDLLDAMRQETDTRFLVVTHNPVTMSRMDRLFGVTMAERGVSQLVSVDLEAAEQLREAV